MMDVELKSCPFCEKADFGIFSAKFDKYSATIHLVGGSGRFPKDKQFKFCPECGRSLQGIRAEVKPKLLTLEELRECDGKPVWIERGNSKRYRICEGISPDFDIVLFEGVPTHLPVKGYGETWLAYDRQPKGE